MTEELKILHLEDNENDAELIRMILEGAGIKFSYLRVEKEEDFVRSLKSNKFNTILSDYSLPSYDGLSALQQAVAYQPETPFIFVSGTLGEDVAVESMKKGATDYVLKNNLPRLLPTLRRALDEVKQREERKKAEDRYRTLIESARDVIFTLSPDGILTSINSAFENITGWNRNDWIGKDYSGLVHKDDFKATREKLYGTLTGKVIQSYEVRILTKNGTYLTGEFLTTPLFRGDMITEILGIVRDVTERKKHEEAIQDSLHEKEILLKEIHHRVKNNLQIISSLLTMQSKSISDSGITRLFTDTRNRVMSMSYIHQSFYQSSNLSEVDFSSFIEKLVDNLFNIYGVKEENVLMELETSGIKIGIDTAIPCGLIINEIVSNSLKYAFPDNKKGIIKISIIEEGDNYILTAKDDGPGIPSEIDFNNTSSLGIVLIRMLTEQIEGDLTLNRSKGTEFIIKFPSGKYHDRLKNVKIE